MISNIYKTREGQIVTEVSNGRLHYPAREKVEPVDTYPYSLQAGDNYYTLAAQIFADDGDWWVLADMNPPQDAFAYEIGDVVQLPKNIVAENRNKRRIF